VRRIRAAFSRRAESQRERPRKSWPSPSLDRRADRGPGACDVASACRLALDAPDDAVAASPSFVIAAADTVMNRPSVALLEEVFAIGYEAEHPWRDHIPVA
jgi:hypothetical protein